MLRNTFVQLLSCPQKQNGILKYCFPNLEISRCSKNTAPSFLGAFLVLHHYWFLCCSWLEQRDSILQCKHVGRMFFKEIHTFTGNIGNPIRISPKGREMKSIGGLEQFPPFAWIKLQPLGRQSSTILVYSFIINHSPLKINSLTKKPFLDGHTHQMVLGLPPVTSKRSHFGNQPCYGSYKQSQHYPSLSRWLEHAMGILRKTCDKGKAQQCINR
jgi:hypothetical protein